MNSRNKPNGHSVLPVKSRRANHVTMSLSGLTRAASVDASELSVANATASSAAAGAEREACAEVALGEGEGKQLKPTAASQPENKQVSPQNLKKADSTDDKEKIPPGTEALPIDGEAFVDAVHSRVDLVLLEEKLLNSKDEKVAQRELAYLRELRYGKRAAIADDEPQIIFDVPGPDTPERIEP